MANLRETHSCGVAELANICNGVVTEDKVILNLATPGIRWATRYGWEPQFTGVAQVTFIDVRFDCPNLRNLYPSKNGEIGVAMAKYIKANKLGTCVAGRWTENPVHPGRKIKTYVWSISPKAYKKWIVTTQSWMRAEGKNAHTTNNRW